MSSTTGVDGLYAVGFRIDDDLDLIDFAAHPTPPRSAGNGSGMLITRDGVGIAGVGIAAAIEFGPGERAGAAEAVHRVLSGIEVSGASGAPAPFALGALPFDPDAPGRLLVPAIQLHRRPDGSRWAVAVGHTPATRPPELRPPGAPPAPSRFDVAAAREPQWWMDLVAHATDRIRAGELRKVVLAREIVVTANRVVDPRPALRRLRAAYPTCYVSFIDGFLCASPELLVSRQGDVVRAHPMAGTAPRLGDPAADARLAASLLANPNYRHEHQLTIDMVHDTLLPWCSFLDAEPEPSVVAVANVQHLATLVEGRLSRPEPSVLDLVTALHPTPAVGGDPRQAALALQREIEQLDRRRYAGPVGWVDAEGNGAWAVGVRSAEFDGATVRVYAGNGIVADSDPATELAETQAKFAAVLGALVRP